jgi:hypothetical protein
MSDQNTTGGDAGGSTGGDTSQITQTNDGYIDWDALEEANAAIEPTKPDDNGIVDLDAEPADEGEGETEAEGDKKPKGEGEKKPEGESDEDKQKAEGDKKPKGEGEKKPEGESDEDKQKRLSGAQRSKLQRQRLLDDIAARDKRIEELEAKGKQPAGNAGDTPQPPKEADFNGDWFAYQRALAAFDAGEAARKATQDVLKSRESEEQQQRSAREARERDAAHIERVDAARETIADYDKVMEGMKGVQIRVGTINEIKSSEKSHLISYHFANNPDELTAFDDMTPREQAREIGRLEATLKMPEPKKQTTAPPPLSKPKGGSTPRDQNTQLNAWLDKKYGKDRKK